uniref:Ribonuclease P protein subunit p29 n=1 Tax=Oryzias latipes TaxID=8090 RepID=A0A3P9HST7_ORYLA
MEEALVRAPLPRELLKVLGVEVRRRLQDLLSGDVSSRITSCPLQPQSGSKAAAFTEAFLGSSLQRPGNHDLNNLLTHKAVILGYARPKKQKTKRSSKRAKGLTAQQKKALKVFQIRPEHQRLVWTAPVQPLPAGAASPRVVSSAGTSSSCLCMTSGGGTSWTCAPDSNQHVVRSKCPSYVGLSGILLQEFKHVFKIITREDRLKVIPKRNSVFSVEVNGFVSHIYGSRFEQRASERSAKKFKVHGSIDL